MLAGDGGATKLVAERRPEALEVSGYGRCRSNMASGRWAGERIVMRDGGGTNAQSIRVGPGSAREEGRRQRQRTEQGLASGISAVLLRQPSALCHLPFLLGLFSGGIKHGRR